MAVGATTTTTNTTGTTNTSSTGGTKTTTTTTSLLQCSEQVYLGAERGVHAEVGDQHLVRQGAVEGGAGEWGPLEDAAAIAGQAAPQPTPLKSGCDGPLRRRHGVGRVKCHEAGMCVLVVVVGGFSQSRENKK